MEMLDPTFIGTISICAGLWVAMLLLGAKTRMLELRESTTHCPSCRRLVQRGTVCPCAR